MLASNDPYSSYHPVRLWLVYTSSRRETYLQHNAALVTPLQQDCHFFKGVPGKKVRGFNPGVFHRRTQVTLTHRASFKGGLKY